jgi:hypothetical protein
MSTPGYRTLILLFALAFCGVAHNSSALVLDWSTVTWPAGSLNNSYDVDPAKPGNDLTVTVSGDTSRLLPSFTAPNPQTPAITQTFQGGFGSVPFSLELRVDYQNTAQAISVTVDFSPLYALGVTNVSFTIFDIDSATYVDQIGSITALSIDGVTQVAPTISGVGTSVTLAGSGLIQTLSGNATVADSGAGSGDGNATITFDSAIKSFTFTYGSGAGAPADPTTQKIGLFNIDFIAVVPEINPAVASVILCLLAVGLLHAKDRVRRRRG